MKYLALSVPDQNGVRSWFETRAILGGRIVDGKVQIRGQVPGFADSVPDHNGVVVRVPVMTPGWVELPIEEAKPLEAP